jgi:hypothetical protein
MADHSYNAIVLLRNLVQHLEQLERDPLSVPPDEHLPVQACVGAVANALLSGDDEELDDRERALLARLSVPHPRRAGTLMVVTEDGDAFDVAGIQVT